MNVFSCVCFGLQTLTITSLLDAFQTFQPRIARLYSTAKLRLKIIDGILDEFLSNLQFHAASLNVGNATVCDWHRDSRNLVWGICAVGAFGQFNHRTSAQLLLKEPRLIIELKRGGVVFFPSGSITHRNAPLAYESETRKSMAFYASGSNFRWIAQGHRGAGKSAGKKKADNDRCVLEGSQRWQDGWKLYTTLEELLGACKAA